MIIRTKKPSENYTIISNAILENTKLDWRDLGLLVFLLSKHDNWNVSIAQLTRDRKAGRDVVYKMLSNLKAAGYVETVHKSSGGVDYKVYDYPQVVVELKPLPENTEAEKPLPEKPFTEKPFTENPNLISTIDITSTIITKQKQNFVKPTVQEIAKYCNERNNGLSANQIFDHYEANGWVRGKTKIKDWKACVRTWETTQSTNSQYRGYK